MHCLVVGATGYIGRLLVPRLLAAGHTVGCMGRRGNRLAAQPWADAVARHVGDVADRDVMAAACRGVDAAFYLVHSMDGPDFAARDRQAAGVFATAARAADMRRIVYLGGLQPAGERTSAHLASRREVGDVLLASGVPTAALQAGIVVGAGSASFAIIQALAEASPVLPLPDQAWNRTQPIGIDDVLHHLTAALQLPAHVSGAFDIGGRDVLTYGELITGYAAVAGLPRPLTVPLPVSTPRLAARMIAALAPVDRHLATPLLASMAHEVVCRTASPTGPPPGGPTPYAEAVRRALAARADPPELVLHHSEPVDGSPADLWEVIAGIGGEHGWYTVPGVFALRGAVDRLLRGGPRHPRPARRGAQAERASRRLEPGAELGWWRIEDVEPGKVLRLRAELRLPGVATLEMRVEPATDGCRYEQRLAFRPHGPTGRAYWAAQAPTRRFVFAVMARTIAGLAA